MRHADRESERIRRDYTNDTEREDGHIHMRLFKRHITRRTFAYLVCGAAAAAAAGALCGEVVGRAVFDSNRETPSTAVKASPNTPKTRTAIEYALAHAVLRSPSRTDNETLAKVRADVKSVVWPIHLQHTRCNVAQRRHTYHSQYTIL